MDDFARLSADLSRASGRIGRDAANVVRKTAHDIEADAKRHAPVDTGTLRASIGVDLEGDGRSASIEATVGPTVHYGPHQEYGTTHMQPQPYMGPAVLANQDDFYRAMADVAGDVL